MTATRASTCAYDRWDIKRSVPVVAVADGKVLRIRDGVVDRLVTTAADRRSVAGKGCGNGIVIQHADGLETQYCHLRLGSVAVKPGETVKRGDVIGAIGASGMAQFPHVHLTVRLNGKIVDPFTGKPLSAGCTKDRANADPIFAPEIIRQVENDGASLLAFGLAGEKLNYDSLVVRGPPPRRAATPPCGPPGLGSSTCTRATGSASACRGQTGIHCFSRRQMALITQRRAIPPISESRIPRPLAPTG